MNDGILALIGASLGVGYFFGATVHPRYQQMRRKIGYPQVLVREMYKAVDDITGASKEVNQTRADRRRAVIEPRGRWSWFKRMVPRDWRTWYANYRWPVPRSELGTPPLPPLEVMASYVWMGEHRNDWFIRYTTESAAGREELFLDYLIRGRPGQGGGGVIIPLGLKYEPDMFQVRWDRPRNVVRLTLRDRSTVALPDGPPMDVRSSA